MKTVGTKIRVLMLVLAFVLVANMAPAHAIDMSLDSVKTATLQDETAITVNGIVMPYRPYLIDGELYAPVQMTEIAFNATWSHDAIGRIVVVGPKVEMFSDKSYIVTRDNEEYVDRNLPEYAVAKFLCGTRFFIDGNWWAVGNLGSKIAEINGQLWMSLDAMASFTGSVYKTPVAAVDPLFTSYASITQNKYMTFPDKPIGPTDVLQSDAGQPYRKFLTEKKYPYAGTWTGADLINVDGVYYNTTVTAKFEPILPANQDKIMTADLVAGLKFNVTKHHIVVGGPFDGQTADFKYQNVPFKTCGPLGGNYFDFDEKTAVELLHTTIPAELIKGMDGQSYYYGGMLYHDYGWRDFFGTWEHFRKPWTRIN